jgi:phospholipase D1/2
MARVWIVVALVLGLALAWALTPLRELIDPRALLDAADSLRATGWGIALIVPLFVVFSVVMIPTSVLRWTTIVAFDPLIGVPCMVIGVMCAAFLGHALGTRAGAERLANVGSARFAKIRARLERTGVLGIAALRQVPLGPFMFVNAACGAARVPRKTFLAGTLVGMVPSTVVMVLAGASLRAWLLG